MSFDLISARSETYAQPGALPTVKFSTIDDDLRRRLAPERVAQRRVGHLHRSPHVVRDTGAERGNPGGIELRDGRKDRIGGKLTLSATQFGMNLEGPALLLLLSQPPALLAQANEVIE